MNPFWWAHFSDGLKPPTRFSLGVFCSWQILNHSTLANPSQTSLDDYDDLWIRPGLDTLKVGRFWLWFNPQWSLVWSWRNSLFQRSGWCIMLLEHTKSENHRRSWLEVRSLIFCSLSWLRSNIYILAGLKVRMPPLDVSGKEISARMRISAGTRFLRKKYETNQSCFWR